MDFAFPFSNFGVRIIRGPAHRWIRRCGRIQKQLWPSPGIGAGLMLSPSTLCVEQKREREREGEKQIERKRERAKERDEIEREEREESVE